MKKLQLTPKNTVFNYSKPYIIAELGSNHNGDMQLAKKLINEAKRAGADCVKFQSWSKSSIFSKQVYDENFFLSDDYRDRKDHSLESIVEAYAISEGELLAMKAYADEVGIDCTSTPFSENEADFLVEKLHTPFIKVASMDLNNFPFLSYLARKNLPIVLSTGLSSLSDIDKAIRTIEQAGNRKIAILHCVSNYPPKDEEVNLRVIQSLQRIYPDYPIGFSDHTLGITIPLAAVTLGACIIEKHFTLDKAMEGWDHKVSATKDEMEAIVAGAQKINVALGTSRIEVIEPKEKIEAFRRSIVARRELQKGDVIVESDLTFKRPGSGIPPEYVNWVIGRQVRSTIQKDVPIKKEQLI